MLPNVGGDGLTAPKFSNGAGVRKAATLLCQLLGIKRHRFRCIAESFVNTIASRETARQIRKPDANSFVGSAFFDDCNVMAHFHEF